ncbi:Autophagy protein 5 [Grifola frondosa]|uniref:Autophagy protein 5 n=1 Tax=Grifola frondosa TaxID=5627 RepID=A0A1C7LR60_GRIFR|nr:Autophagy protein 5 [Grifola frondosa]
MDVVFDEAAARVLKEEEWWFESEEGSLLKWHWPIGLLYDNHSISLSTKQSASSSQVTPLRLILHLASPPTDKLLLSPSAESCKQAFMGQMKEADFIRWGNTKRMTGLRKAEQDGLWEGIKEHNFDEYWRVASKVTPTTTPTRSQSPPPPPSSTSMHTRPPSADPSTNGGPDRDGPRSPILEDGTLPSRASDHSVRPLRPDLRPGSTHTLARFLTTRLPLLFPSPESGQSNLACAFIQGVPAPHDTEMAWLGACMAGADGWVNVCVGLQRDGAARY